MPRPQTPLFRNPTRTLARALLEEAVRHPDPSLGWALHGLGVLRARLPGDMCLHVWCPDLAEHDGAATIHSHPWKFSGFVVAGIANNHRYEAATLPPGQPDSDPAVDGWRPYVLQRFRDKAPEGEASPAWLRRLGVERVVAGSWYTQDAADVHESRPMPGTVTLIQRQRGEDTGYGVYYPAGGHVGAGERPATAIEIRHACAAAVERWLT